MRPRAGHVRLGRAETHGGTIPVRPGKMRVVLNVHGGQQALADVIEGLVQRNARAIASGAARPLDAEILQDRGIDPKAAAWRDAPVAQWDDYLSGRTAAAWLAGTLRVQGQDAAVGFIQGRPTVFDGGGQVIQTFGGPTVDLPETEGRTDERLLVTIDDNEALPVREINQAIARHNARQIREKGLPPLYRSGVRYKTEGSPELWWDAQEILANGFDDCEGLAAYRAGELINQGYDAQVWTRLVQKPSKEMGGSGKSGGRLFHAITRVNSGPGGPVVGSNGEAIYDDPSARLGMPRPDWYTDYAKGRRARGLEL